MAKPEYRTEEDRVTFNIVDKSTVDRLRKNGDIELPYKTVDIDKDMRWNTKQMASKLLQGILNGDSIPTIAGSLTAVIGNNKASAVRNARTMITGAENVGRLDSYKDLADQGVVQKKVWIATPDDRTRESHIDLDGEEVDIDQVFSNDLEYPGDPNGDPSEVYNCRCSMRTHIIGFRRADGSISEVNYDRDDTMHNEQMEEEKMARQEFKEKLSEEKVSNENIERDYDCDFAKNYGKDYYDAMCDRIDSCGDENLKAIWEQYQSRIGANDPNYKGRAYASVGNIHVNKTKDAAGSSWEMPYEVTFHESGHAIDWLTKDLAETDGLKLSFSSAYENGLFPDTIKDEVQALVDQKDMELKALFKEHAKDYVWLHENGFISDYSWHVYETQGQFFGGPPKYTKALAYKAVENEIKSIEGGGMAIGDLSDILEGATKGKISCGYGHGKSYWKPIFGVEEKLATEAFAEMTSATTVNGKSLETIKRYLPRSYAVYCDMLKDITSKLGD